MRSLARVAAVLAFLFCLLAGLWILLQTEREDVLAYGIGLYFVGKAFFVGPMLWLAADRHTG